MGVQIDASGHSINKYGEELCGNIVKIMRGETGVCAILADGKGSGVRANMLASLAVKMISSMLDRGEAIGTIANIISDSQLDGKGDSLSYSGFTLIQVLFSGTIYLAQAEMPEVILLHQGKPARVDICERIKQGKTIRTGMVTCKNADTIIAVSNGVLNAGIGPTLKRGWQQENITTYMMNAYYPKISAGKMTRLLLTASDFLYKSKPEDDLSVLTLRLGK